jgi:hypothetical protein
MFPCSGKFDCDCQILRCTHRTDFCSTFLQEFRFETLPIPL